MKLKYKLVKDIFSIDNTLTRSLSDNFGLSVPDWTCPQMYWFVIFDNKQWVGYAALRVHDAITLYSGPTYIKPDFRGQGLQVKLLKKRINLAKKLGYSRIISSTYYHNYPSNNSLIKCGFRLICPWLEQE